MDDTELTGDEGGVQVLAGRYELGPTLGQGGMGEVRAGRDRRLERAVAIKLLRADMAHQPDVRNRFENEARMAARLTDPHVVAVFDSGEEAGIPFLVMERLSGQTLADVITAGPQPWAEVQAIGLQIMEALNAAHVAGMIHRDVKPGNVMAAGPGSWKVGDFGIAKTLEVADHSLTTTGLIIGTARYLPPERLAGGPATISGDLYGASVVLYELLTGHGPVEPSVTPAAIMSARPRPVSELRPDIPPGLAAAVMRAIDPDPAARFAGATEMADALRRDADAPPAAQTVAFGATPSPTELMPPRLAGLDTERRRIPVPGGRNRSLAAAAAAAVVLIVVSLIVLATGRHGGSGSSPVTSTPPAIAQPGAQPGVPGALPAGLDGALRSLEQAVRP